MGRAVTSQGTSQTGQHGRSVRRLAAYPGELSGNGRAGASGTRNVTLYSSRARSVVNKSSTTFLTASHLSPHDGHVFGTCDFFFLGSSSEVLSVASRNNSTRASQPLHWIETRDRSAGSKIKFACDRHWVCPPFTFQFGPQSNTWGKGRAFEKKKAGAEAPARSVWHSQNTLRARRRELVTAKW